MDALLNGEPQVLDGELNTEEFHWRQHVPPSPLLYSQDVNGDTIGLKEPTTQL